MILKQEEIMVSIILPVYNGAKYLAQSIDSIIAQTYQDWELIIVNDCSTDNSLEIAENYAHKDDRIKIINNETNNKLPKSLNIGFRQSIGKYLTWTSDDNMYCPNAIEKMVSALETGYDHVFANMEYIDEHGKHLGKSDVDLNIWKGNNIGACFLYKRDVYEQIGGYAESLYLVEDYEYWIRVIKNGFKLKKIPEILYKYRRHPDSLTSSRAFDVAKVRISMLEAQLSDKNVSDKAKNDIREQLLDSYAIVGDDKKLRKNIKYLKNTSLIKIKDLSKSIIIKYYLGSRVYNILKKMVKR